MRPPHILDTNTGRILFALHGAGAWDTGELAPDLYTFIAAAAAMGAVFHHADEDLRDDDWVVKPEYRKAAMAELAKVFGDASEAEAFFETLQG